MKGSIDSSLVKLPSASTPRRVSAFLFDITLISWMVFELDLFTAANLLAPRLAAFWLVIALFIYPGLMQSAWGCTLGQRLLRMRVVDRRTGSKPSARQSLLKASFFQDGFGGAAPILPPPDATGETDWERRAGTRTVVLPPTTAQERT